MSEVLPPVIAELRASISEFSAKMQEAKGEMDEVSAKADETNDRMATLGKGLALGFGAAAVAVGGFAIDMAMKNQEATATLSANADITVAKAKQISDAFLDTAGKSVFTGTQMTQAYAGVAAELSTVQGHALSTGQAILVMKSATDLAEASGTDLTTATTALGNVMQAYQVQAKGAAGVGTLLFNVARETGTSLSAVSTSVTKLHSTLGTLTPPLSQVGGLLIDMTEHGETGRKALSALNSAMTTLLKGATGTAQAQANLKVATDQLPASLQNLAREYQAGTITSKELSTATEGMTTTQSQAWSTFTAAADAVHKASVSTAELGINVVNAQGKFVGMREVIAQLQPKLEGMTQAQQLATLATVFGSSANKTLLTTILAGPAAFDKATAAANRHKSEQEALAAQMGTLKHEFEVVEATVEDYGAKLGNFLLPKIEDLIHVLGESFSWLDKNREILYILGAVAIPLVVTALGAFAVNSIGGFITKIGDAINLVKTFSANILGIGTASSTAADKVTENSSKMQSDLNETSETAATTSSTISDVSSNSTVSNAAGGAGTSTSVASLNTAAEALQTAASSLDEAAASLKGVAGEQATVAESMAENDANASALDDTNAADDKAAAGALDGAAEELAEAAVLQKESAVKGIVPVGGGASEGEEAAGAATEEDVAGEAIAGSLIKGAIGKGIGGLIAVQLYDAFAEKPLSKVIGKNAASALGDAGTGAAVGFAVAGPWGAAAGAAMGLAFAEKSQIAKLFSSSETKGAAVGHGRFAPGNDTMAPNTPPPPTPLQQDQAKDSTLQKQLSVLDLLKAQVFEQTAAHGKSSAQAEAAQKALVTTEQKYLPGLGKLDSLTDIKTHITTLQGDISQLKIADHADQLYGNDQLSAAKSTLKTLKETLATEVTGKASKAAIDLTHQEMQTASAHLADIKSVVTDGSNAEKQIKTDTTQLSHLSTMEGVLSKINSDTTTLHNDLSGAGINVAKLPSQTFLSRGQIILRVSG